jgi:hypothetical protein
VDDITKKVISALEGATGEHVNDINMLIEDLGVTPADVDYVIGCIEGEFGISDIIKPSVLSVATVKEVADIIRIGLGDK